ncbi:MAG TPA: hypothetical protein VGC65_01375 [Bacteroidia bacterium]|jgi:hypothetical protein
MLLTNTFTGKNFLLSALIACLLIACSGPESKLAKYGPEVANVLLTDNGAFRGLNLGDKMDSVIAKEGVPASEADEGYLYYELQLDSSCSYNISYNFDENGLNEIQSDIYIKDAGNTEKVFDCFKRYFDDHYGKSELHQGFTVWTVKSDKFGEVKINLSDESSDLTVPNSPGKIAIWIYPSRE